MFDCLKTNDCEECDHIYSDAEGYFRCGDSENLRTRKSGVHEYSPGPDCVYRIILALIRETPKKKKAVIDRLERRNGIKPGALLTGEDDE